MWTSSSRRCDSNACVRVNRGSRTVWIGDSNDDPHGQVPVLVLDHPDWRLFLAGLPAVTR